MTKKKWILTASLILIPLSAVWIYLRFFQPDYLFHEPQSTDVEFTGSREIKLTAEDQSLQVGSLELELSGKVKGIMDIVLVGENGIAQIISVKGPKVEHSFAIPWNQRDCTLRFIGRDGYKANFHIDYRFVEGE